MPWLAVISMLPLLSGQSSPATPDPQPPYPQAAKIPDCNSYNLQNLAIKLNAKQRACIWRDNLLTSSAVFGAAFTAGYAQLFHTDPPEWGHGPEGYARSFGSRYAAGMAKATGEYLASWTAGQDPRPRRSHSRNILKRVWYAGSSLFVDRQPDSTKFAPATTIGALASGFSGMAWYPASQGTAGDALKRAGTSLGGSLAYREFYEFEPDIFRIVGKIFTPKLK